ncbi:MAG TPA: DUF885 family protein, partial [Xanthomonadaceae bacterium]|nr:DUF885 family protein [Xanthomonadaceae bacterium]
MHKQPLILAIAIALCVGASSTYAFAQDSTAPAQATQTAPNSAKAAQLDKFYADFWEASLKLNPVQATYVGDPRYNDQLPNFLSKDYIDQANAFNADWLAKAKAIGSDGLSGQALLSYNIFIKQQQDQIDGIRFHNEYLPIDQFNNLALLTVQLGSGTDAQPFATVKDYDNWLARASKIPTLFDQAIANMREGVKLGIVEPKVLMIKV